MQFHIIVV